MQRTRGWPCVVVNDNWRKAPWARALYACDGLWWDTHAAAVRASGFSGELWTQDTEAAKRHGLNHVTGRHDRAGRLSKEPGVITFGNNSGFQAMNLAYHWGARRLLLLGFDCKKGAQGNHWFGDHKPPLGNYNPYARWLEFFTTLAKDLAAEGVTVLNCSRDTALTCFPRATITEVLEPCAPAA